MLQAVICRAIGIPVAIFCVRYVKSQLYEITTVNVPVMAIAIGPLVLAAAVSGIIPARRAASAILYEPSVSTKGSLRDMHSLKHGEHRRGRGLRRLK